MTPDPRLRALQEALTENEDRERIVGQIRVLARAQEQLAPVADTHLTVLLLGETGTGKGLAARAVHDRSRQSADPFIPINGGAIPEGLVESELFGHEPGAFTGAVSRKLGKVAAGGGQRIGRCVYWRSYAHPIRRDILALLPRSVPAHADPRPPVVLDPARPGR